MGELDQNSPIWYYNIHDYDDDTEQRIEGKQEIVDRIYDLIDEIDGSEMLFTSQDIIEMLNKVIYPNA